ncbi:PDZ domain-containing protein [Streptomyces pluripotens]|uniref:PDZ domain-containing protein n=1 Tax=Streptomyces pluripotens TaxID=1355015 RepID=A0A221P516_9ACTN|nr:MULTISPECIES: PDZ domain-containing protein [Streptomyces]ARP72965.1 PDZ domain-containing protein [Streptomyces pluripotens]ASN27214.1 PDZ domain-containing protein [Streptomyces pluripotens]KIE28784.1 membrane protein [Streptomyces sp. MUSC 125]MCH0557875.1 PDZ domain-containing protein [Streptomyces sp. MUM 16J]
MEQTALRPKPMPGQDRRDDGTHGPARRPHAARRRGRRLRTLLFGLVAGSVLVLAGVGIGTVGSSVTVMSKLAQVQRQALPPVSAGPHGRTAAPGPAPAPSAATLGIEAVDAEKAGALVVGVHVPGPGYTAGLVRGDILLQFGGARVDTAADLARAVAHAPPGKGILLTVRHRSGGYQQLTVVPGVMT